jgi:hypothetical protein
MKEVTTWGEWLEKNRDSLANDLNSGDWEEALFKAYLAGIERGGSFVTELYSPLMEI